ncbi:Trp biosynthesis-associated membrane protein [Actinokineospora diospyrosa]|uniref:Tryptophan-associated transmembrane protein (Trp_oprn_chp) n=1 Tax=Actinokineospora diospyrosa TaxID=103728 RepID=A0ABT1IKD8_9PSEU|nr:Trp biosynthesis-associated membrane protein [Actinokineospora diospyrosa]MCP2272976.1 Tryptophan-associated transmembrane protein (Trp_oprn_chp) [Actinokineospora diospyrosa]
MAVLLPVSAAALWGAARLPWEHTVRARPGTDATTTAAVPGEELVPALVPLAVLALAAIAGALALSGLWRRLLGAAVGLLGLVPVWSGLTVGAEFAGRALAVAGGVLMLAAGVLLVVTGHRAPRLGGRYRSPGAAKESARVEEDLWAALSEGQDPTLRRPPN